MVPLEEYRILGPRVSIYSMKRSARVLHELVTQRASYMWSMAFLGCWLGSGPHRMGPRLFHMPRMYAIFLSFSVMLAKPWVNDISRWSRLARWEPLWRSSTNAEIFFSYNISKSKKINYCVRVIPRILAEAANVPFKNLC